MNNFLQKINLQDSLTTELDISRNDFIAAFEKHVDKNDPGLFYNFNFSARKNRYQGTISYDAFSIKRRRGFNRRASGAKGMGTFTEKNGKLLIETVISGADHLILIFGLLALVYLSLAAVILVTGGKDNDVYYALPFILVHGALMFTIFYFVTRRNISNLKYDLEREFYYWTKK